MMTRTTTFRRGWRVGAAVVTTAVLAVTGVAAGTAALASADLDRTDPNPAAGDAAIDVPVASIDADERAELRLDLTAADFKAASPVVAQWFERDGFEEYEIDQAARRIDVVGSALGTDPRFCADGEEYREGRCWWQYTVPVRDGYRQDGYRRDGYDHEFVREVTGDRVWLMDGAAANPRRRSFTADELRALGVANPAASGATLTFGGYEWSLHATERTYVGYGNLANSTAGTLQQSLALPTFQGGGGMWTNWINNATSHWATWQTDAYGVRTLTPGAARPGTLSGATPPAPWTTDENATAYLVSTGNLSATCTFPGVQRPADASGCVVRLQRSGGLGFRWYKLWQRSGSVQHFEAFRYPVTREYREVPRYVPNFVPDYRDEVREDSVVRQGELPWAEDYTLAAAPVAVAGLSVDATFHVDYNWNLVKDVLDHDYNEPVRLPEDPEGYAFTFRLDVTALRGARQAKVVEGAVTLHNPDVIDQIADLEVYFLGFDGEVPGSDGEEWGLQANPFGIDGEWVVPAGESLTIPFGLTIEAPINSDGDPAWEYATDFAVVAMTQSAQGESVLAETHRFTEPTVSDRFAVLTDVFALVDSADIRYELPAGYDRIFIDAMVERADEHGRVYDASGDLFGVLYPSAAEPTGLRMDARDWIAAGEPGVRTLTYTVLLGDDVDFLADEVVRFFNEAQVTVEPGESPVGLPHHRMYRFYDSQLTYTSTAFPDGLVLEDFARVALVTPSQTPDPEPTPTPTPSPDPEPTPSPTPDPGADPEPTPTPDPGATPGTGGGTGGGSGGGTTGGTGGGSGGGTTAGRDSQTPSRSTPGRGPLATTGGQLATAGVSVAALALVGAAALVATGTLTKGRRHARR